MTPDFKNERVFTNWFLKQARARGWKAAHLETMRVVRTPNGPRAVANADATGFPDVVLVHETHGLIFAELKMRYRKPDAAQLAWHDALRAAHIPVYVFYPADIEAIVWLLDSGGVPQMELT